MRWNLRYKYGDYRVIERFLWLPMHDFLGTGEVRWLVRAKFAQKCIGHFLGLFTEWSVPYKWADDLPVGDITFSQYDALG